MSGQQDASKSDIFHPDWRPGQKTHERARWLAVKHGLSFEEALERAVQDAKDRIAINRVIQHRTGQETSALLREGRGEGPIYPKPGSVRDIPSGGFETNRRRH